MLNANVVSRIRLEIYVYFVHVRQKINRHDCAAFSPLGRSACVWPVWLWRSFPCRWSSTGDSSRRAAVPPWLTCQSCDLAPDCADSMIWWAGPEARGGHLKSSAERDRNSFVKINPGYQYPNQVCSVSGSLLPATSQQIIQMILTLSFLQRKTTQRCFNLVFLM